MPAIYHEGSWLGNATDPEVLVKDTVGWTGKNLLPYPYYEKSKTVNGITFTVNNDGSVTVNGTATAGIGFNFTPIGNTGIKLNGDYIISGNSAFSASGMKFTVEAPAGRNNNVEGASDVKYTFNNAEVNNIRLWIYQGTTINNVTIYPMIRRADITDPTYEPYHESVEEEIEQIYADNGVLGAKNLLPYPYFDRDTLTNSGITYTVNSDKSVTLSGTATANSRFYFVRHTDVILSNVKKPYCNQGYKYVLSAKGVADKYNKIWTEYVYQNISNGNWIIFRTDNAQNKKEIILPSDMSAYKSVGIYIVVSSGTEISTPITIYPMIRLASDPDDTYQPYAMTNSELTEKVFEKRTLSSGDDLNNITETGIYHVSTSVSNVPENRANLTLIVNGFDRTQIRQVLMTRETMYTRSKEGATWKPWYKYTGTEVS